MLGYGKSDMCIGEFYPRCPSVRGSGLMNLVRTLPTLSGGVNKSERMEAGFQPVCNLLAAGFHCARWKRVLQSDDVVVRRASSELVVHEDLSLGLIIQPTDQHCGL